MIISSICSGRGPPVLRVRARVSVSGEEDVSRSERGHDAASGHGGPPGAVLCVRRGRVLADDGLADRHHLQLQVLLNTGRRHHCLPHHCLSILLHTNPSW